MEFHKDDQVIVNPLAIKQWVIDELEASLVLYYTGASRASAAIIDEQKANISGGRTEAIEATHRLKENALKMKKALLAGNIPDFARIFGEAWEHKKKMAGAISNLYIQSVFEVAMSSGATAGKVSGAGGGGFIIFAVAPEQKFLLTERLNSLGGRVTGFHFSEGGPHGWKVYNAWK
jgi:D-glycero-alpha-D-manno-heptose-7-phosphate kinase